MQSQLPLTTCLCLQEVGASCSKGATFRGTLDHSATALKPTILLEGVSEQATVVTPSTIDSLTIRYRISYGQAKVALCAPFVLTVQARINIDLAPELQGVSSLCFDGQGQLQFHVKELQSPLKSRSQQTRFTQGWRLQSSRALGDAKVRWAR